LVCRNLPGIIKAISGEINSCLVGHGVPCPEFTADIIEKKVVKEAYGDFRK
jgi:hypothetical protein